MIASKVGHFRPDLSDFIFDFESLGRKIISNLSSFISTAIFGESTRKSAYGGTADFYRTSPMTETDPSRTSGDRPPDRDPKTQTAIIRIGLKQHNPVFGAFGGGYGAMGSTNASTRSGGRAH